MSEPGKIQATESNHAALLRQTKGRYVRHKTPLETIEAVRSIVLAGVSMKSIAKECHVSLGIARDVRDGKR